MGCAKDADMMAPGIMLSHWGLAFLIFWIFTSIKSFQNRLPQKGGHYGSRYL